MGYEQEQYRRIREEYHTKYLVAREEAERRRAHIHAAIPAVAEIDAELQKKNVEGIFITNGIELFVAYTRESGMFGKSSHLNPIVFRCDTTLETFEYIGCTFYDLLKNMAIIKIN